ncbi:hypothetical protein QVD17_07134 [Tagetes erecta]|uniref:Uncharacterized protein n=1 Tax=Tagetes erecta TaxID=13708 RepID=A0AAD8PBW2_TARER|nr:hypothetical protein QVD17_07134 [Tagetes erecta]
MQPNCLVDGGMSTIAVTDQAANINGLSISRKCRYLRTALFYIDYFTTNNLPWMLQWSVAFVNFTKETKQLHKQIEQQLKLQPVTGQVSCRWFYVRSSTDGASPL